jgi:ketosteroid isomerase-like protein
MSTADSVKELVAMVEQGNFVEAIEKFYAPDATMHENNDPPRVGLAALLEGERRFLNSIQAMPVHRAESFVVDGDRAAIHWIFEMIDSKGKRRRLDEIAYQLWRDGKIVSERFYYDPARGSAES